MERINGQRLGRNSSVDTMNSPLDTSVKIATARTLNSPAGK